MCVSARWVLIYMYWKRGLINFCLKSSNQKKKKGKIYNPSIDQFAVEYNSSDDNNESIDSGKISSSTSVPPTPRTEGEILQSSNLKSFTFSDVKMSTRNFRPDSVLGGGGFGSVFKGWIDENSFTATKPGTGIIIAVKKLHQGSFQGHREWLVSFLFVVRLFHFSYSHHMVFSPHVNIVCMDYFFTDVSFIHNMEHRL